MRRLRGAGRALVALAGIALIAVVATGGAGAARGDDQLQKINHIVVIYEENHSFDNLYGGWEGVNGLANADAAHTTQVDQNGTPYSCLFQLDVNLTSPPLSTVCSSTTPRGVAFNSHFLNAPFTIDDYIPADATTCPKPKDSFAFTNGILNGSRDAQGNLIGLPGGCTRDIVHKFYQEQYQLNGGAQNRYATGSDAAGLVMGVYNTRSLQIYQYLHANGHPHYAIADNLFQAAFDLCAHRGAPLPMALRADALVLARSRIRVAMSSAERSASMSPIQSPFARAMARKKRRPSAVRLTSCARRSFGDGRRLRRPCSSSRSTRPVTLPFDTIMRCDSSPSVIAFGAR